MTSNLYKRFVWDEFSLKTTAEVIAVINIGPNGTNAEIIADHIRYVAEGMIRKASGPFYVGTGGWYVTAVEREGCPNELYCLTTVMAYMVQHYLKALSARKAEKV